MNNRNSYFAKSTSSLGSSADTENIKKSNRSSVLPAFLKWFKKSDHKKSSYSSKSETQRSNHSQESIEDTFGSVPDVHKSLTSSSSSIASVATTGFAFVPGYNYIEKNTSSANNAFVLENISQSDSMLRRIRLQNLRTNCDSKVKISLKDKYCLYETDTLKLTANSCKNHEFYDRSLPNYKNQNYVSFDNQTIVNSQRRSRRTASDSCKDKKAGAYIHVKGKRRAPLPPESSLSKDSLDKNMPENNNGKLNTLGRKKRRAPPPPIFMPPDQTLCKDTQNETNTNSPKSIEVNLGETPLSPSPRPWYKRPLSTNRDSSIPFKREVLLKTFDKRKENCHDSEGSNQYPEFGYSRASIFDGNKFGFLIRNKEEEKKFEGNNKRRSGIPNIPNISELDKEAAEMLRHSENRSKANLPDHLILQQEMFGIKPLGTTDDVNIAKVELKDDIDDRTQNPDKIATEDFKMSELTWSCPFCTLNNPSWRIICEVCEKLKPLDRLASQNLSQISSTEKSQCIQIDNFNNKIVKNKISDKNLAEEFKLTNNWQKKAYQIPMLYNDPKIINEATPNRSSCSYDNEKMELIDSSAIVTTITPVYFAEKSTQPSPMTIRLKTKAELSIDEVRQARLNKFDNIIPSEPSTVISDDDPNSLEIERQRLREKIRAMNAKALADKYPVLKKNSSVEENSEAPDVISASHSLAPKTQNLGAIKKVFVAKPNNVNLQQHLNSNAKSSTISSSIQTARATKEHALSEDLEMPSISSNEEQEAKKSTSVQNNLLDSSQPYVHSTEKQCEDSSKTDTVTLTKIMRHLETAIAEGDYELAGNLAIDLAKMKVSLHVTKTQSRLTPSLPPSTEFIASSEDMFLLHVLRTAGSSFDILVDSKMKVSDLKKKVSIEHKLPEDRHRWSVEANVLYDNTKTLAEYGIYDNKTPLHLELVEPVFLKSIKDKRSENPVSFKSLPAIEDLNEATSTSEPKLPTLVPMSPKNLHEDSWVCPLCTLINSNGVLSCSACTKPKPRLLEILHKNNFKEHHKDGYEVKNDLNKTSPFKKSSKILNIVEDKPKVITGLKKTNGKIMPVASYSPNITKNKYRGVDNFNPSLVDTIIGNNTKIEFKEKSKKCTIKLPAPYSTNHYLELLKLDTSDVVPNTESFDCPICLTVKKPFEGVILRDCLHSFCRECLSYTIKFSEEPVVKCPFMDSSYSCDCHIQEREIKALVSTDTYEKHLAKSIREAQHNIENAFYCKTPNCRGWCIYEDNANQFKCPICKIINCVTCRIIHDGLTCKQYQDRLNTDCDSNTEARRTIQMLKEMVEKGEAMNCPTCKVIMMKKWGCDWLKCSMCKTEVCWVTRGPRWGPAGKGDVSGGCKCGIDGKKCHPKCNYCH